MWERGGGPGKDAAPAVDAAISPDGASAGAPAGGVSGVGGTATGGVSGADGTGAGGGTSTGAGGVGGTSGTEGGGHVYGMPCTTDQDCPSDATCCDGSDQRCDGTRLPSGDGANPGQLVISADGLTVTDATTGLLWQRDGAGTRAGCSGTDNLTCTWAEAKAYCASLSLAGVSGWRLPAMMELATILDVTADSPAIDGTAFPDTPSDVFWTSSPRPQAEVTRGQAWVVQFDQGSTAFVGISRAFRVRCVRGSRCYPKPRFVVISSGLVQDTLTNLMWLRQESPMITWAAAQTFCSPDYRLPTLRELLSLVDLTVTSAAAIDATAFPNASSDAFLVSSPYIGLSSYEREVSFGGGGALWGTLSDGPAGDDRVRCVR